MVCSHELPRPRRSHVTPNNSKNNVADLIYFFSETNPNDPSPPLSASSFFLLPFTFFYFIICLLFLSSSPFSAGGLKMFKTKSFLFLWVRSIYFLFFAFFCNLLPAFKQRIPQCRSAGYLEFYLLDCRRRIFALVRYSEHLHLFFGIRYQKFFQMLHIVHVGRCKIIYC